MMLFQYVIQYKSATQQSLIAAIQLGTKMYLQPQNNWGTGMKRIPVIMLLCVALSCRDRDFSAEFKSQGFDKQVIANLPVYDSMVSVLVRNYSVLWRQVKQNASYHYEPPTAGNNLYELLPAQDAAKVKEYTARLGDSCFYGFDLYKDSSVKFLIKESYLKRYDLYIREKLSYYPAGSTIKHREFPVKDTILNSNWQYWISFDEQRQLF